MLFITSAKASELAEKLLELTTQSSAISARMLKIRQIMEQLFKAVTEDVRLSFNGLFARMQYVSNIAGMDAGLQMQANKLRILCNEIAHDEISEPSENTFTSSILTVYNLLLFFCPDFIDEALAQYLFKHGAHAFTPLKENTRKSFLCVVKTWKVLKEGNEDCALEIESVCEDGTACVILLKNDPKQSGNDGKTYTMLAKSLWQYANLHCYELTEVIGRKGFYQSSHSTLVVLEPDFLIDASALAECFSSGSTNPEYYIINRMIAEPSTEAMLQGSVVNSIFDELVFGAEDTYIDLFKHSLANLPVALVAQGKDAVKRIYSKVEADHLPQLKSYIGSLANAEILLEPSFICPEYGLQGRLDLLSKQDDKYSILELKSGKAHPQDIWKGNQMQVIAYNMIIRSVYGANRINNASILYSACKENPLRHVSNVQILEQNLLMCRNRILGILHLLVKEPKVFFDWLIHKTDVPESPFMKQKLERIKSLLTNAEDFQYEWFLAQIQRIISEIWSVKTGNNDSNSDNPYGHNALWQQGKAEKINSYKIVTNLIPTSYDRRMIVLAIP
ncbi:MAG: PD-(D/E)XK nuclease family protein, partial [Candidatus Cloacimonetes bacterium]|nr:PD-(D/E)XK nuclease family protein [Candidatus Cloacimonadota bacterium]